MTLSEKQRSLLDQLDRRQTNPHRLVHRVQTILAAADGVSNDAIARRLNLGCETVRDWRQRWSTPHAPSGAPLPDAGHEGPLEKPYQALRSRCLRRTTALRGLGNLDGNFFYFGVITLRNGGLDDAILHLRFRPAPLAPPWATGWCVTTRHSAIRAFIFPGHEREPSLVVEIPGMERSGLRPPFCPCPKTR